MGDSRVLAILALLVGLFSLFLALALGGLGAFAYKDLRDRIEAAPVRVSSHEPSASGAPHAPPSGGNIPDLEARTAGPAAGDDEVWGDLGDAYKLAGRRDDAVRAYRKASELDGGDAEWTRALRELDDAAWVQERMTRRIPELEALVGGAQAANDEIWGDLGDAYREAGRTDDAVRAYRKARELDADDAEWSNALRTLEAQ